MNKVCVLLFAILPVLNLIIPPVFSQSPAQVALKKPVIGPLKPEDYPYYVLVKRHTLSQHKTEYKPYYTLPNTRKYRGNERGDFSGHSIVMDIRTGKEIAWWPERGKTYWAKREAVLVSIIPGGRNRLVGFDTTGVFKYDTPLGTGNRHSAIGDQFITLSTDWKRGIFVFNNDLWVINFDLKTGKLSNPRQATFNGAMPSGAIYFKGDHVITSYDPVSHNSSSIVNLKSGKFTAIEGFWSERNNYITDLFYMDHNKEGWWSLIQQTFVPASANKFHAFWTNSTQTSYLYIEEKQKGKYPDTADPIYFYYQKANEKPVMMHTPHMTKEYNFAFAQDYSPYFAGNHNVTSAFSPDSSRLLIVNTNDRKGVVVLDFTTHQETIHPLPTEDNNPVTWTDSTHLFFNARPGMIVNGESIETSNQGTYVYDITTRKHSRISAYFTNPLNPGYFHPGLAVWTLRGTSYTVFEANNLLFRCRPDGSELIPLVDFPGLYKIEGAFLSSHPELN